MNPFLYTKNKDLEQRRNWYSSVAAAYNNARPRYCIDMIRRVVDLANLSTEAKILELGCGPGNATVSFAQMGFSMLCLEPSAEACDFARQNCEEYSNVKIQNTTFEEWNLPIEQFDAVLAANSFHWIPPEIACSKAAEALRDRGSLILLWNMTPEPQYEVYQILDEVYQIHASSLSRYEGSGIQANILKGFGQTVIASGRFRELLYEQFACEVTYKAEDYLTLLSTFSPYRSLDPQIRASLFSGLKEKIEKKLGGTIQLFYLSAFHISQKAT